MEDPENRANIELGQPIIEEKFEKESVEATIYAIEEALGEFYRRRSVRNPRTASDLQVMRDPMRPYAASIEEIKKEDGDMTIPLAILEAALGEIQLEYDILNSLDLDAENQSANEKVEAMRQSDFERGAHYQEAADVLFSHEDYETPTRDELLEYLGEAKTYIRKRAKEEEKKYGGAGKGEGVNRIFRSRLLTDVPAIERYETGRHITGDYHEIMDVISQLLFNHRDRVGTMLLQYARDPQKMLANEIKPLLKEIRNLELLLSQLEGERNERIAKKQQ